MDGVLLRARCCRWRWSWPSEDPAYEDVASKFFEHFVAIADAMNTLGGTGLWDEEDGFYYDQLHVDGQPIPLQVRSMVGLIPLFAVEVLEDDVLDAAARLPKRHEVVPREPPGPGAAHLLHASPADDEPTAHRLLAIPSRERLERVLRYLLDENEFLSPYGIRSLSRVHSEQPVRLPTSTGEEYRVDYDPGESDTGLFGGNSNWRGPIWFPVNYLLVEALERYHHFYGDALQGRVPDRLGPHA